MPSVMVKLVVRMWSAITFSEGEPASTFVPPAASTTFFAAAMRLPFDPGAAITAMLAPGIEGLGERLVRVTLKMLAEQETRDQIAAMIRDGADAAKATAALREFLETVIVDRVAAVLRVPDARMRVSLATSYIVGVVISRYVMRMEPLASASEDKVVRLMVPAVQSALAGEGNGKKKQ